MPVLREISDLWQLLKRLLGCCCGVLPAVHCFAATVAHQALGVQSVACLSREYWTLRLLYVSTGASMVKNCGG